MSIQCVLRRVRPWSDDDEGDGTVLELEKAWHGLHYLYTGDVEDGDEPAGFLVAGGEEVEGDDAGYGPPRVLAPEQVRAWADFLAGMSDEDLRGRYDPERMTELAVYPEVWQDDDAAGTVAWLLGHAGRLRQFVAEAAAAGEAITVQFE